MPSFSGPSRRFVLGGFAALPILSRVMLPFTAQAPDDRRSAARHGTRVRRRPPSYRPRQGDHRSRRAPKFVPPEERIATFDQDGTLWVEHPCTRR